MSSQFLIIATILLYLIAMVLVGTYFSKHSASGSEAFYLGGRKLGPLVTAMSAEASDMSSYLLMGLPGLAYLCGLPEVSWTVIGLAAGTYLNWLLVAKKIRRYSEKINAITIPEFFSKRYHDDKNILTFIAAVVILVFFIPYTASGFKAVGTLFNSLFGWDYHTSMIIGAAVIVLYTVLGGFMAVSTTDLIQSIFMTFALVVVIFFATKEAGGSAIVMENVKALPGYLTLDQGYNVATKTTASFSFLDIVSTLAWGLGYFGMPHILLRFMAIRDENELKLSRRIASIWVVVSMFIAIAIGVIGYGLTMVSKVPLLGTSSDSETIIIKIADLMANSNFFFAIIAGIILAGILAATMSTADSQLLAAASSVSHDLMNNCFKIKLSEKKTMLAARITVICIAFIAIFLAWNPNSSVFRVVSFAWAGFGGAFGPVVILALFWKRSTKSGAIAGMAAGGAMVFIWKFIVRPMGGALNIYELLPAFIINFVVMVIVSLLTKAPEADVVAEFESVKA